jgi:hypothetical protein
MTNNKINKALIYDEVGIGSIRARALKEIISKTGAKSFVGQEIILCDKDKAHGIITLNEPHILDTDQFKSHSSRHLITDEGRENIWPGVSKFNAFSFRIKKIFKDPIEFVYIGDTKLATGEFVEGVTIKEENIDYSNLEKAEASVKFEEILEAHKAKPCKEEDLELKTLFLELYELFAKRLIEKSLHTHDARERARIRAEQNRKKKPKKKTEATNA